jgi:hypothetical protein
MKLLLRGLLLLVVVLGGLSLISPPSAQAAEGFNIITSPLPIKLTAQPGQTVQTELRLKNQGTEPETIKVGLMKFGASGEEGQPNLFDITTKDSYASWVHFSPQQFVAQPNVWLSVKMTINVPKDAALGYYMAVTFSRSSQPGEKQATNLKGAVATLVLLDVKSPNEKRALQIVSFTSNHGLYEYLPTTFKVKLHNSGNIYIAPAGNIFIQRGNTVVDTLNFNEAGGSILPQSNRTFSLDWKSGFPLFKDRIVNDKPVYDKHGPKRDLKWDFTQVNKFRFGRYSAKLLVVYDNGTHDVPMEATLNFWVLPWKAMLLGLVVLALVGFGIYSVTRSTLRKTKENIGRRRTKS